MPAPADWKDAIAHLAPLEGKLVVLIGGGGFLGTHVAQELLRRGARLRVAARHPEKAIRLRPLANLGQIQFARCNAKDRRSLEAVLQGADAAVYLVGTWGGDQYELQAEGAGAAASIAAAQGASAFVYISAIGAEVDSESSYAATKAEGERRVLAAFPKATVLRPSILFGEDDAFLNMFAGLIARVPALKYCSAFGETYEEAAREIAVAMRLWLESSKSNDQPIPAPGPTIEEFSAASEMLNLKEVARRLGIPPQTLYAKVRRGTALKPAEALAIARELNEAGLHLVAKAS